jgi:hypothetical protein
MTPRVPEAVTFTLSSQEIKATELNFGISDSKNKTIHMNDDKCLKDELNALLKLNQVAKQSRSRI